jgi:hypothetical protein
MHVIIFFSKSTAVWLGYNKMNKNKLKQVLFYYYFSILIMFSKIGKVGAFG